MGYDIERSRYHVGVVHGPLTRNIAARFTEVRDEIIWSFRDEIPAKNSQLVCYIDDELLMYLSMGEISRPAYNPTGRGQDE